ncbi:SRPBCC domain-containing protein [Rothia uropygialis]|uniref:SRPBCC domain-containing protein n=1 Tax=Kocuria sp. 36 TaxID=1415402 RepID=UPI0013ECC2C6|nr:SRPBCC domain-containing protein [Kocuria sp. 36]
MAHTAAPVSEPQDEQAEERKDPFARSTKPQHPAELQLERVYRQVGNKENHHVIVVEQTFTNPPQEVWAALTEPENLAVWLEPVNLTSKEDRRFKTEKTGTEGTIQIFDPPRLLQLTWENGGEVGELQISITQTAAGSSLTLRHRVAANDHWDKYGAGATGVGWDGAFLALHAFLNGRAATVRQRMSELEGSEQGHRFIDATSKAWEQAQVKAGTDEETARAQAERTAAFYKGAEVS